MAINLRIGFLGKGKKSEIELCFETKKTDDIDRKCEVIMADEGPERISLNKYCDIVTSWSKENIDNLRWWFSWPSCRHYANVELMSSFTDAERIIRFVKRKNEGNFFFKSRSPNIVEMLVEKLLDDPFVDVEVSFWTSLFLRGIRFKLFVKAYYRLVAEVLWTARNVNRARANTGKVTIPHVDCAIVTLLDVGLNVESDGFISDRRFGHLARFLAEDGEDVLFFGPINGRAAEVLPHINKLDGKVLSYLHLVDLSDSLSALKWLVQYPKIKPPQCASRCEVKQMNRDIRSSLPHLFRNRLLQLACERLAIKNPSIRFVHLYENNCWERVISVVAKEKSQHVTGYLHAYMAGNLAYFTSPVEQKFRPGPDRIVTVGPAATDVFKMYSPLAQRAISGCNLNREISSKVAIREHYTPQIKTVLVLLGGFKRMIPLLIWLRAAVTRTSNLRIVLRGHPASRSNGTLDILLQMAGVDPNEGDCITIAPAEPLDEALANCDAVIYKNSTAIFAAARQGLPLIYFNNSTWNSDDPLVGCQFNKYVVGPREVDGLCNAVNWFDSMSGEERRIQRAGLKAYVEDFSSRPTALGLSAFSR